ncbi:hypothetical protein BU16DRAFT_146113 [Lophium mytilinum]|uniref:Uncharacterized protein n=1 Tax=Lophium mytilinum TaxID=390894 RepID=A0A6A6QDY2_9PEZI|nr:hypothetical protein BU16DRAFT_146113 [Lophium mytilinum]
MAAPHYPPLYGAPKGVRFVIFISVLEPLAIAVVCLRLWARHIKRKRFSFNDYAVLGALFVTIILSAINFVCGSFLLLPTVSVSASRFRSQCPRRSMGWNWPPHHRCRPTVPRPDLESLHC